jgi:hypothetical protein
MEDLLSSLINERVELCDKLEKLANFIYSENFNSVSPVQRTLLQIQYQAMVTYQYCLSERISWLTIDK